MSFEKTCLEIANTLNQHGLIEKQCSDQEVREFITGILNSDFGGAYPLEITQLLAPGLTTAIQHYDDCNQYQAPGYYIEQLGQIATHSRGGIDFSELSEDFNDDGTTTLAYSLNGVQGSLNFSTQDTYDSVPEAYVEFVKNLFAQVAGSHRYLQFDKYDSYIFCRLPTAAARELSALGATNYYEFD